MDAFVDAVAWHDCAFLRTGRGDFWRIFYRDELTPLIEQLNGDEPEWHEPLAELKRRALEYIPSRA